MKILWVTIKNVYGNELVYPACNDSRLLAQLSGCKTFTNFAIAKIKELGYTLKVTNEVTEL